MRVVYFAKRICLSAVLFVHLPLPAEEPGTETPTGGTLTNAVSNPATCSGPGVPADAGQSTNPVPRPTVSTLPKPTALRIERAVFLVKHDEGRGTGFLMEDGGLVYFVSNIHVLAGGENFSIRNVYGETVTIPEQVQVAADRDLVRFPVNYKRGLLVAQDFGFDDEICALGNSGGEGVVTRLDGKILALGPDLVEISATIIPGNSGGPVVDNDRSVVGVSTYVRNADKYPDWLIKGSRFEKGVRRMAVRVDNVEWVPMAWGDFQRETHDADQIEEYACEIISIVEQIYDKPDKMIFSDVDSHAIQSWIRRYNQDAKAFGGRLVRVVSGDKISYKVSPDIESAFLRNLDRLAELMDTLNQETLKANVGSTRYFKDRMNLYSGYFESCKKRMEMIVETRQ